MKPLAVYVLFLGILLTTQNSYFAENELKCYVQIKSAGSGTPEKLTKDYSFFGELAGFTFKEKIFFNNYNRHTHSKPENIARYSVSEFSVHSLNQGITDSYSFDQRKGQGIERMNCFNPYQLNS